MLVDSVGKNIHAHSLTPYSGGVGVSTQEEIHLSHLSPLA